MKQFIYLDHSATTPMDPEVFAAMEPFLKNEYGNPSAQYALGHEARKAIDNARSIVAGVLNCSLQEVIFTAGGTESDNLAILGAAREFGAGKVVTTNIEHSAVLHTCEMLREEGFTVEVVAVENNGILDVDVLKQAVDDSTVLVSVMMANNEIGTIQPVAEAVQAVREKSDKALFHTDACQAPDALHIDVKKLGVDLLTINGSKIYGPKGTGALYVKQGVKLKPIMYGGHQEQALRPGTENVAGIVGFAKALELAQARRKQDSKQMTALRDKLIDGILAAADGAELNGDRDRRLPKNANIFLPGVDGEALLMYCDQEGIQVSLGSACSAGSVEPSHVLLAIGRSKTEARQSLRLTLGRTTTEQEIDTVLDILPAIIKKVKALT
ncbi:MAG: cysteine desulfurase family protein [Candidatus Kerfeldbacteria bacterium]